MNKPVRILFVCHGNICRSPMAEFVMKFLVSESGLDDSFVIDSKATSTEEIGNPPYPPVVRLLGQKGIPMSRHRASQIRRADYENFDLIIGMDSANMVNMERIFGGDPDGKLHKLRSYSGSEKDIEDPWYTGDFETVYAQITAGCKSLLSLFEQEG